MSRKHRQRVATQERISADALASPYLHPEGPRGTLEVPATYLRGIARPQCFVVENNCLAPLGIVDGDSVLIDAANTAPRHGEIVACTFNGELLLKAYLCHSTGGRRLGFYLATVPPARLESLLTDHLGTFARGYLAGLQYARDHPDLWAGD